MTVVGYLASDYFAPSHTFIRREVGALRRLGETIAPFSVRRGASAHEATAECILDRPWWHHLVILLCHLRRRPAAVLKAWRRSLSHRAPGLRGLVWSQFHFFEASTLAYLLQRAGIGHLHCHFANSAATVALLSAKIAGIEWSLTLHGVSETDYPAGLLLSDKIEDAKFVAVASRFMLAQAMRICHRTQWNKLHLVRCGVSVADLPQRRKKAQHQNRKTHIVCVGRLVAEKGYPVLAEALSILTARACRFELEIVGDGSGYDDVLLAFRDVASRDELALRGALDEGQTLEAIAAADILVLPSLMEGLPVVLIEAMGIGVPVVATWVAGIPELVENGISGLLVAPTDPLALADAIEKLASDPKLAKSFVEAGTAAVTASFTIEETARRMKLLLHNTTEKIDRSPATLSDHQVFCDSS